MGVADATTHEILAQVPLFSLLDADERRTVAEHMDTRAFPKGHTIFTRGDVGDSLMVVRQGLVQIFVPSREGARIVLGDLGPRGVFGELTLFDPGPRTATSVAVEDSQVLVLRHDDFRRVLRHKPEIALHVLAVMGKQLRATDELLRSQVARNVNEEQEEGLTFGQRIADKVAEFGGSWTFIIFFGCVMVVWMTLNVSLGKRAWDEYPFILLNLALSSLAALQAPIIMMSQNRQSHKDRLRADLDYKINLKAELEVAELQRRVDQIYEAMQAHFATLEKDGTR
jgi:CRP/FNR family transcriptional regulator, cyclic AMP receptor protein